MDEVALSGIQSDDVEYGAGGHGRSLVDDPSVVDKILHQHQLQRFLKQPVGGLSSESLLLPISPFSVHFIPNLRK